MANQKQVAILKQGVEVWNKWRSENLGITINLAGADLCEWELSGANLSDADLTGANLMDTGLRGVLSTGAILNSADLRFANLRSANLTKANLFRADLGEANLTRANLRETDLNGVRFSESNLRKANLERASTGNAVFGKTDLSETMGLDEVHHKGPSTIGIDTLQRSKGKIPIAFLHGCGLSDLEIEYAKIYNPSLSNQEINDILYKIYDLRARQAIQVSPLFISYSHADAAFVDQLEVVLNEKGIRFWRDIHDARAGRLETQIEQAIRHNPTVLVVLSKNSTRSDWVEHEVRTARGLEKELKRDVLCPVALDDSWKSSPWPGRVMEQVMEYNILDFSKWKQEGEFEKMFKKLVDGLDLFYKK